MRRRHYPSNGRLIVAGSALLVAVVGWRIVAYYRSLDLATWGLHGIARAMTAYAATSGGRFPDSWADLESQGIIRSVTPSQFTVEADLSAIAPLPWHDAYHRGVKVNRDNYRVGWGGRRLPSGLLIESTSYPDRLAVQALHLTQRLASAAEELRARESAETPFSEPESENGIAPSNLREEDVNELRH